MLLRGWDTPSISDALELMGCDDSFVRAYAVQEVSKAKERHANGAL